MDAQLTAARPEPSRPSAARARILATADRLFYAHGIRAVGVDRVVSEAEVTRVTFYRHFASKDQLIAAYLQGRLERDRSRVAQLRLDHPGDPRAVLTGILEALASDAAGRDFRGCAYANLAAEYCDADHPARDVAAEHRAWLLGEVEELLHELGVVRPRLVAEQLVMLRAGAMAVSAVEPTAEVTTAFADAWGALIDRAL
jgi:AcrR family transcriptional regulator